LISCCNVEGKTCSRLFGPHGMFDVTNRTLHAMAGFAASRSNRTTPRWSDDRCCGIHALNEGLYVLHIGRTDDAGRGSEMERWGGAAVACGRGTQDGPP